MPVTVTAAYASSSLPSGINGLIVEDQTPIKIGDSAWELIDSTERRLDLSVLGTDYPLNVELEAREASCLVRQGDSTVLLASGGATTMNARILEDGWRLISVDSIDEAYIAIKQDTAGTGTLVATRIDKVG